MKTPDFPLDLADRCVKCGLCLPHCPTYQLAQDEAESPRGRIALMQGLATGMLQPSTALAGHLDRCLGCRNCEPVCPAHVPYGEILDAGRNLLNTAPGAQNTLPRWTALFTHPRLRRLAHWTLWLAQRAGLVWIAQRLLGKSTPGRLLRYLPPLSPPQLPGGAAARGAPRGTIALFRGCVSDLAGQAALHDCMTVLTALGYEVIVPEAQGCCGAMHLHNGQPTEAAGFARRNQLAFGLKAQSAVGCDSGCIATLKEYSRSFDTDATLPLSVNDVCAFVEAHWDPSLELAPLPGRVALHLPCTQRNVLRSQAATIALLKRIPDIELLALNTGGCCGAAGTYFLTQPEIAGQLATPLVRATLESGSSVLASGNIGCALHLRAQVPDGNRVEVLHPISLIARQLRR